MTTALDVEESLLVDTVREFVDRDVKPTVRDVEHANEYPEAWIEQMKRIGIYGLAIPEEYGGAPVSMPLAWDELGPDIGPAQFTVANAPERLAGSADPWTDFRAAAEPLTGAG